MFCYWAYRKEGLESQVANEEGKVANGIVLGVLRTITGKCYQVDLSESIPSRLDETVACQWDQPNMDTDMALKASVEQFCSIPSKKCSKNTEWATSCYI